MYTSHANRGMAFEDIINKVNQQYKDRNIAFIEKKPTPINVVKTKGNKIHGHFDKKSSVDYSGVCNGRSIFFEAKSTKKRTSFPLANIKEHQIDTLKRVKDQGAIAFFLIEFRKHQEVYILTIDQALEWIENIPNGGRKSIPYEWFTLNCDLVKHHHQFQVHYLDNLGVLN